MTRDDARHTCTQQPIRYTVRNSKGMAGSVDRGGVREILAKLCDVHHDTSLRILLIEY